MAIGETARGAFHKEKFDVGSSGIVSISELDGLIGQDNVFVQDVRVNKREKQTVVQCFGEVNHVYAFGADPLSSQFSVTLAIFLVKECNGGVDGSDIGSAISTYDGMRVSQNPSTVSMTVGGGTVIGTATGFDMSVANPQLNMVNVSFLFTAFQRPTQG